MEKRQFVAPAWAISLVLHGAVIGLALAFSAQIKPLVQENLFSWDVALVQRANSVSQSKPVDSMATSALSPVSKVLPSEGKSAPGRSRSVVKPMEQRIDTSSPSVEQKAEVSQVLVESAGQRVVEAVEPNAEPDSEAKESRVVASSSELVESQPIQREMMASALDSVMPAEVPNSQEASAPPSSMDRTVPTAVTPGSAVKADNRWLAESLWQRVAELKRYPNMARMNGQEGKVILKAVIRSDGQLADVVVQKSSGYSVLDEAAIEAVKRACPLDMKHAMGKPQIVVSLPIVYSLAN